jgi:hypothetical protein
MGTQIHSPIEFRQFKLGISSNRCLCYRNCAGYCMYCSLIDSHVTIATPKVSTDLCCV